MPCHYFDNMRICANKGNLLLLVIVGKNLKVYCTIRSFFSIIIAINDLSIFYCLTMKACQERQIFGTEGEGKL